MEEWVSEVVLMNRGDGGGVGKCLYSYSYIIIYLTIYSYIRMHMGYG